MSAFNELCKVYNVDPVNYPRPTVHDEEKAELYWYFGYGSNLNSETFLVKRGIKPLQHQRMIVPGWRLNFEISGIPYLEPGFGSIDRFTKDDQANSIQPPDLQGVAYLVTAKDYQHIIATEGGDSSYKQIQLDAIDPVTNMKQQVWTLQAVLPRKLCQPSVRYITIIRQGAREHNFPKEYIAYLDSIEPFVLHGKRQKIGAAIFIAFWMPIIIWLFAMRALLTRPDGTAPKWISDFASTCFATSWYIHDTLWAKKYGRGDHNVPKSAKTASSSSADKSCSTRACKTCGTSPTEILYGLKTADQEIR